MQCVRFKRDSMATKEIPLIGTGFQAFINNLFWFLPFSSSKQAFDMLAKKEMSDDNWIVKREEVAAEHQLAKAPADLKLGWKAWLVDSKNGAVGGPAAAAVPVAGITSLVRD